MTVPEQRNAGLPAMSMMMSTTAGWALPSSVPSVMNDGRPDYGRRGDAVAAEQADAGGDQGRDDETCVHGSSRGGGAAIVPGTGAATRARQRVQPDLPRVDSGEARLPGVVVTSSSVVC